MPTRRRGAPCNHGTVEPPSTKLVTFPALSCNDLLCIYGEEQPIPPEPCGQDVDCNMPGENTFVCEIDDEGIGACRLSLEYVLARSMCSKSCSSDADCNNEGLTNRPTVDDEETACEAGFSCTVLQELGEFCCEKLCVCKDELPDLQDLVDDCATMKIELCEEEEEMP